MWLNGTSRYAIRAVLHLAEHAGPDPVRVDDIAAALGCPRNYLSKTLYTLARAGVLHSTRGPGGGFWLAEPPAELSLARIVAPFEPATARPCLIGRPQCGGANPCLVHHRWERVAKAVTAFFEQTTVRDLLQGSRGDLRLEPAPSARRSRPRPTRAPR